VVTLGSAEGGDPSGDRMPPWQSRRLYPLGELGSQFGLTGSIPGVFYGE
jgi:hypothetical protein